MELTTFSIPTFRKEAISKRLDKLAKKANKYGNSDISYSFGDTKIVGIKNEDGYDRQYEFVDIIVTGDAPIINGWNFLARVELMDGENLIHNVPGTEVEISSDYREHNGHCDHCNTLRARNDVYILSKDDEEIAVGRTCLRDFLGIDDPKGIVNRAQFFEEIRSMERDEFGSFGKNGGYDLHEVLLISAAYIREKGYVSRAKQADTGYETTGECVQHTIDGSLGYSIKHTDTDREWVTKTLEFFRRDAEFGNTYMDNIRVLVKQDIVRVQHMGLIASSVITAQRELAPKEEKPESNFVGEVKERLRGLKLILNKVIFLGHGQFGPSYLHLMSDSSGNVFSWITGNKIEETDGTDIVIDGTVKEHKLYNGVNQTVLTRAKLK
jgi:hypothetical protein